MIDVVPTTPFAAVSVRLLNVAPPMVRVGELFVLSKVKMPVLAVMVPEFVNVLVTVMLLMLLASNVPDASSSPPFAIVSAFSVVVPLSPTRPEILKSATLTVPPVILSVLFVPVMFTVILELPNTRVPPV